MKGMCWREELSFATSIFVPPPTAMMTWGLVCLIFSSAVWMSFMVAVWMISESTVMFACSSWWMTVFPAILLLLCPARMRAEPVSPSLFAVSETRLRVPFPTMTSRGSCM